MIVLNKPEQKMIQPAWSYKSEGVIWRLVPTDSGFFIGELRNLESKRTSFFCLDRKSGKVVWEEVSFNEQWWIGIEGTDRDRLFLHGFSTPDMPGHKGIIAVDVTTGRVVWQNPGLRFILCSDDSVFASSEVPDGLLIHELDYRTGETHKTWNNQSESLEAARTRARVQVADEQVFPQPLEFYEVADDRVMNVLHKHCLMENVVGSIDVLVMDGLLFFSYHERENEETVSRVLLRQMLRVANLNDGKLEFTATLNAGVLAAAPDSFFIVHDMLCYIKDRSSVMALLVNDLNQ